MITPVTSTVYDHTVCIATDTPLVEAALTAGKDADRQHIKRNVKMISCPLNEVPARTLKQIQSGLYFESFLFVHSSLD